MSVPPQAERADWARFWRDVGRDAATLADRNRIIRMAFSFKNEPLERWRQSECDEFLLQLQAGTNAAYRRRSAMSRHSRLAALPADGIPDDVPLLEGNG